jgi:hypothetical protein
MAKFSQQFLANLGKPQMAESLFGLGTAIGSLPGQMKQKKEEDKFNTLMADAQKAQQANNEAQLFSVAQQLRAMGRNTAANTVAATATKLRETNRQKGLASAISSAEQLARQGADIQPLLQDITQLGGTPEQLKSITSIVRTQDMNQKEGLLQQTLASPEFNFERPTDVRDYYKGASQMGVTPKRAQQIFNDFKAAGDVTFVNAGEFVDTLGNPYNAQVERDKSGREVGIRYVPIGSAPPYSETTPSGKPNPLSRTEAYGLTSKGRVEMEVEEARQETLETEFAEVQAGATVQLPELRTTKTNLEEAIRILGSEEVRTGGVPRAVSRSLLQFMGLDAIPQVEGEFEAILSEAVMARLQGFEGAISDGERQYAISNISDWMDGNRKNIGRLSVLLDRANMELDKSIRIGEAEDYNDYRRSSGIYRESDFISLPPEDRRSALEAVKAGRFTYNQIIQAYKE